MADTNDEAIQQALADESTPKPLRDAYASLQQQLSELQTENAAAKREAAFKREFPDSWLKDVTTFDAKLVTFDRNLPYNDAFCEDIKDLLDGLKKGGWGAFTKQSKKVRDQARMEFKPCD